MVQSPHTSFLAEHQVYDSRDGNSIKQCGQFPHSSVCPGVGLSTSTVGCTISLACHGAKCTLVQSFCS